MDELINKLEEIKASLTAQGVQALQNDADIEIQVIAGLPKVRQLLKTLRDIQTQQNQNQAQ